MPLDENQKRRFDKSKLPSRHVTVGPNRAPHRSMYYAMGLTEEEINQPFVGVATCWNEAAPCNIALSRQAQATKSASRNRRHPARVHHDHRHRRYRDGPPGHEVVAGQPRGDRGFDRAYHARPLLRRDRRHRRLRQVAAGDDDGDGPAQRAGRVHVRRLHPAGRFQDHDVTVQDVFEGVGAHAAGKMSEEDLHDLECSRLPVAPAPAAASSPPTPWPASPRRSASRCRARPARPRPTRSRDEYARASGRRGDGPDGEEHPPARHRHPQGAGERGDGGRGLRRVDQRRPAPAGDGARGGIDFDIHDVAEIFRARPTSPT